METVNYGELESGLDLRQSLLDKGLVRIQCEYPITMKEFESLAHSLGKPLVTSKHVLNEARTVQELSNNGLFGDGEVEWHHDWSYGRGNYFGTILYNVKNAHLSETWFCDMSKAPDSLKEMYKNCFGSYYPPKHLQEACFNEKQLRILEKQKVSRPFIINHHVTGEEILYCSIGSIRDMPEEGLGPIKRWAEENCFKYKWEPNDILLWDNLKMMHKRFAFKGTRFLWRTQFLI